MKRVSRDVILVSIVLVVTVSLFGMYLPYRKRVKRTNPFVSSFHVVPTDSKSMHELDLCPLFIEQEKIAINEKLMQEMKNDFRAQGISEADIEAQLSSLIPASGLKYHVFNEEELVFEEKLAPVDSPCVISLGMLDEWDRSLIQYKSLDQFELAQKTSLSSALCAGHALNNAYWIKSYVKSGEVIYLQYLHDLERSANFLLDLAIGDWVNVEVVKENIKKMDDVFGINMKNISAVSSAILFDSSLESKPAFALVNSDEFSYVQGIKEEIMQGLKQKNYLHVLILGNEEFAQEHGHYFTFAIIKSGNTVQYVVLDTMPNVYHLQENSHEMNRVMFIVQNIEQGQSDIVLANIREAILGQIGAFDF